jgi:hypothetical protein
LSLYSWASSRLVRYVASLPLLAALDDARTADQAQRTGRLYASFHIEEVALLRALGFPATLCTGLDKVSFDQLRSLDDAFARGEFSALLEPEPSAGPPTGEGSTDSAGAGGGDAPDVTLLGWSLLQLEAAAPTELGHVAAVFEEFERFLDYDSSWLGIWRPSSAEVKILRYRMHLQALPPISSDRGQVGRGRDYHVFCETVLLARSTRAWCPWLPAS